MEICGSCRHVLALHADRTGICRLNGCPCLAFTPSGALDELDDGEPTPEQNRGAAFDLVNWIALALAFVAGVVVGCQL